MVCFFICSSESFHITFWQILWCPTISPFFIIQKFTYLSHWSQILKCVSSYNYLQGMPPTNKHHFSMINTKMCMHAALHFIYSLLLLSFRWLVAVYMQPIRLQQQQRHISYILQNWFRPKHIQKIKRNEKTNHLHTAELLKTKKKWAEKYNNNWRRRKNVYWPFGITNLSMHYVCTPYI